MGKLINNLKKLLKLIRFNITDESRELNRINKIPRYEFSDTKIFGFDFTFVDSASFFSMYNEIFRKKIFQFNTDVKIPFIIDCGANIGVSVLFFKKLYPNSEIIAFEPDPNIFNILKSNISRSNYSNVRLINKGLWNCKTKLQFAKTGADDGYIFNEEIDLSNNTTEIETETLSSFLSRNVDFLKIDIEGSEICVLQECKKMLSMVKRMFIEYHSFSKVKQNLSELLRILEKNNFRYFIQQTTIQNSNPFLMTNVVGGKDNLLNIYAYREKNI